MIASVDDPSYLGAPGEIGDTVNKGRGGVSLFGLGRKPIRSGVVLSMKVGEGSDFLFASFFCCIRVLNSFVGNGSGSS